MSDYINIFKRYEKKYMLNKTQYSKLIPVLEFYMNYDKYGRNQINNIYYDNLDYRLIRESIEKPIYKEKLRLRSYGIPKNQDKVFIELKKKYDGVVYKRRIDMKHIDAKKYLSGSKNSSLNSQISKEIDWVLDFYDLVPSAYIGYERISLYEKNNDDLKITFDTNLKFRDTELDLSMGSHGIQVLDKNIYLMEIKTAGAMPLWLTHILDELNILPKSFSKYGHCYKTYLLNEDKKSKEVIDCA